FALTPLTTATRTALLSRRKRVGIIKLVDSIPNGPIRQPRGNCHSLNATPTQRSRLRGSPPPTSPLIEVGDNRGVLLTNPFNHLCIRHNREHRRKHSCASRSIQYFIVERALIFL